MESRIDLKRVFSFRSYRVRYHARLHAEPHHVAGEKQHELANVNVHVVAVNALRTVLHTAALGLPQGLHDKFEHLALRVILSR